MGGSALPTATELEPLIGTEADAELKLLSTVSHALRVGYQPTPPATLEHTALLPTLELPPLPEKHRFHFRQALKHTQTQHNHGEQLITLLASRGFTPHPLDWLPSSAGLQLPAVFTPWLQWLETGTHQSDQQELSAQTWEDFYPAQRLHALREMRFHTPATALDLIQQCAAAEPADKRLPIIETLSINLSEADAPYLESLQKDRSQKVKSTAVRFLSRLGQVAYKQEDIEELADFFTIQRKPLGTRITLRPLKTNAQKNRRRTLCESVSLAALAQHLQIDEAKLLKYWTPKDAEGNEALLTLIALTGTPQQAYTALHKVVAEDVSTLSLTSLTALSQRLSREERTEAAEHILSQKGNEKSRTTTLELALACLDQDLGCISWHTIKANLDYKDLLKALKKEGNKDNWHINTTIDALALLATADAAQHITNNLLQHGLMEMDPRLTTLRLNRLLTST